DAADHELRLERLDEDAITAGFERFRLIDRFERTGQEQHRYVRERRRVLDVSRDFVAAASGHSDISQDNVGNRTIQGGNRVIAITEGDHGNIFRSKGQFDDPLDRGTVV